MLSSEKKRKSGVEEVQGLGALIDGRNRTIGPSGERILKMVHCSSIDPIFKETGTGYSRKVGPHLAVWGTSHGYPGGQLAFVSLPTFDQRLAQRVRVELFTALMLHTFLGAKVTTAITASDASSYGGALGISRELTLSGTDFVKHIKSNLGGQRITSME